MAGQEQIPGLEDAGAADTPRSAEDVPGWLGRVLEAGTTWRRSGHARLAPCRKCSRLVLHAADMALDLMTESTVDPAVLDREAEIRCLLAGRYTAELEPMRSGGGPLVFRRDRWLAAREPNARKRLWVPEHRCNDPVGVDLPLEMIYPYESRNLEPQNDAFPSF